MKGRARVVSRIQSKSPHNTYNLTLSFTMMIQSEKHLSKKSQNLTHPNIGKMKIILLRCLGDGDKERDVVIKSD